MMLVKNFSRTSRNNGWISKLKKKDKEKNKKDERTKCMLSKLKN